MTRLRILLSRLAGLFRKGSLEYDLDDELRFHVEMETADNLRKGMTAGEARAAALRRFGDLAQVKETYRETYSLGQIEVLMQDVRYGIRMLRKHRGFALAAVLSLALGIGANTAVFSIVDALLLKPLPYPQPERLAVLWPRTPALGTRPEWFGPGQYMDLLTQNRSFDEMALSVGAVAQIVSSGGQVERISTLSASSSLFRMLGAKPLYGRLLLPEDDQPGNPAVAILSYEAWQRLFGSDPKIVGKAISVGEVRLNGNGPMRNLYAVAGVLSPRFLLNQQVSPTVADMGRIDVFLPLAYRADVWKSRYSKKYDVIARLKPGVTIGQAQADVSAIANGIREKDQRDPTFTIGVIPLLDQVVGSVRRPLLVLLGAVILVLLIACASVANLLLARAKGRRNEVALRMALGAGRSRLARQLLTESLLLSVVGGAAGLAIAWFSIYLVRKLHPGNLPLEELIRVDHGVLAFTFGISILTGIVFGLAPALRAAKVDLNSALKSGGASQGEGGFRTFRHRLRSLLVISELAFSVMLLIGAGLMMRSFVRLQSVFPGYNADHVITMRVDTFGAPPGSYNIQQLVQAISSLPGVQAVGSTTLLPLTPGDYEMWPVRAEDFPPQYQQTELRSASADYFRVMGIPLLKGRLYSDHETGPVAVVDEKFAQHFWPGADPIGKHFWQENFASGHPAASWKEAQGAITVIGVVAAVKQYGLDADTRMALYFNGSGNYWVVRTTSDPAMGESAILRTFHALAPGVVVDEVRTMQDRLNESLAPRRFSASMLGAFAMFALLLAAVGVYGVISYLVAQNTHELGVRIALGAQRGSIIGMVVRQGMELAVVGILAGVAGALALTRVMSSLLFGVSATDVLTFSLVPLILAAIALLASYLPARHAAQMDPMSALRSE
jgi:predicted permease